MLISQGAPEYNHIASVIPSDSCRLRVMIAVALLFNRREISSALRFVMPSIFISIRALNSECKSLPTDIERKAASYIWAKCLGSIPSSCSTFFLMSCFTISVTCEESNSTAKLTAGLPAGSTEFEIFRPKFLNFEINDIKAPPSIVKFA